MNEYLACAIIFIVFFALSVLFTKKVIAVKLPWLALAFIIGYLLLIWLYFELIEQLHYFLRDHKIYIEFGHASFLLLLLFMFFFFVAIGFIIYIIAKRILIKKAAKHLS